MPLEVSYPHYIREFGIAADAPIPHDENAMCGRFAVQLSKDELVESFRVDLPDLDADDIPDFLPRYNIAPSQRILAIGRSAGKPHPKLSMLQWGLIPHFIKDPKTSPAPVNARSESAAQKPMFRQALERRRCLIPADGFYEWKRVGNAKQPFIFQMKDRGPFAFAGIYEIWRGEGEAVSIVSCAIFTTEANEVLRPVHDRMPVILEPKNYALWCDPDVQDAAHIQPFLRPYPAERMTSHPVSTRVNSPRNDDPACAEPLPVV